MQTTLVMQRALPLLVLIVLAQRLIAAASPVPAPRASTSRSASRGTAASTDAAGKTRAANHAGDTTQSGGADQTGDPAQIGSADLTDRAGDADPPAGGDDLELAGARVAVHGPSIGAVLKAAYEAAGLDRDPGRGWIRRARIAGLVPWVTVRTARDTSWQEPQSEVGHSTALELRATWRLDRLLFDSRELQVAALEAARRRERRRLAARVIRSYFIWRRAAGIADVGDDRTSPRVAEATAELDALTDGWFSLELARYRRGAARPPTAP